MRDPINWFGKMLLAGALFAGAAGLAPAQDNVKPDNTKANKDNTPTADQQKEKKSDRQTAQQIRKAITGDKSLSTYAHNVKVIVQDGTVTLKGPVRSDDEKKNIEQKANGSSRGQQRKE